jgi:hypothetical protein
MHKSQSSYNLIIALHVSGITITHLQEHKTTASTASGNHYTVIDRVKFNDKEYQQIRLKLQLLNNVYSAENAVKFYRIMKDVRTVVQLFHDSSRQQYGVMVTRCCRCSCFVLLKMGDSNARNM